MPPIMKYFLKTIYYIFLGSLVGVALLVVISAFPIEGNIQLKIVESGSMKPELDPGDIVMIRPMDAYNVGDIIHLIRGTGDRTGRMSR